jgi:hypothetical protein
MLASAEAITIIVLAIASVVFLLGIGACMGVLASRQARSQTGPTRWIPPVPRTEDLPAPREGESLTGELDTVSLILASSPNVSPELTSAVQKLIKTTRELAQRQEQPPGDERATEAKVLAILPPREPAPVVDSEPTADRETSDTEIADPDDELTDLGPEGRQFPRSSCRAVIRATIHPPPCKPLADPVDCTILTRDLSCGGIGVAYSEELHPKQVIVLNAVGKLLLGEVRWCRQLDERFYIAGCRLLKTGE